MRPGLKTGLRLPTLRRRVQDSPRLVFEDDCSRPSLPNEAFTNGSRWKHDGTRSVRYGENGKTSVYRLLLGTSRRSYKIQILYEIVQDRKLLKFSLFSSPSSNFQGLMLEHYLQHQTNGSLIWYRSDNTAIRNFGNNHNSINNKYSTRLNLSVDSTDTNQLNNSLSALKINPLVGTPTVANYPDMPVNPNGYLYFQVETQDAAHLLSSLKVEVF